MPSNRFLILALSLLLAANSGALAANTPAASSNPKETAQAQTVAPIYEEMAKLVKDYYPRAKVAIDKNSIHFEFKAHMRMTPAQRLELSPDADGIVGDVKLASGNYRGNEPVPRESDQRFHIILTMAPFNPQADAHIFTKLYYPPGTVPEFLVQFKQLANSFATQPVAQASSAPAAAAATQTPSASPPPAAASTVSTDTKPATVTAVPPPTTPPPSTSAISTISRTVPSTTSVVAVAPRSSPAAASPPAASAAASILHSPQFAKGKLRKRVLPDDGVTLMLPADATRKKYSSKSLTASCYQCADFPHGEFRMICLKLPENSTLSSKALDVLCSEIGRVFVPNSSVRDKRTITINEMSGLSIDLVHESQSKASSQLHTIANPAAGDLLPAVQTLGSDMSEWLKNYSKDLPLTSAKTSTPYARMQAVISGPKVFVLFAAGRPIWLNSNIVNEAFDSLEIKR